MNGAQAVVRTLVDSGVATCFANPGTSEMHFVAALDTVPEMRGVLCLFEGAATGAADGYGRMTGLPAGRLLHLGPGPGQRTGEPAQRPPRAHAAAGVVGDHATYHKRFDAPLESDIDALAGHGVRAGSAGPPAAPTWPRDAADAVAAALTPPGQVATLILPADVSWTDGARAGGPAPGARRRPRCPTR